MKDSEDVSSYITRVQTVGNQLKHNRETVIDARLVEKILRSLIDDFENIVCSIEDSRNLEEMIIDDLGASLEAHEHRKKKKQEVLEKVLQTKMTIKEDKAMYAQHNRGHGGRSYDRMRDQGSGNNEERGEKNHQNWHGCGHRRGDRSNRPNVECYNCGKYTTRKMLFRYQFLATK